MNKKTLRVAGWALGLSMAVAGIGAAVGVSQKAPIEAEAANNRSFQKITSMSELSSGAKYLIVYEVSETSGLAFDGSLGTLDATSNTQSVSISSGKITTTTDFYFTIASKNNGYSIKSSNASPKYIGSTGNSNQLLTNDSDNYTNGISWDDEHDIFLIAGTSTHLTYNATSGQERFRYFKDATCNSGIGTGSYKPISLFKEVVPVTGLTLTDSSDNSYTTDTAIDAYEGSVITFSADVDPDNATNTNVAWTASGNATVVNGVVTIGDYAKGTSATVTCETIGTNSNGNTLSIVLTFNILEDSRTLDHISVSGLSYTGMTYYEGYSSWDVDGAVFKAVFSNDTEEIITGADLDNVVCAFYADNTVTGDEIPAPVAGMTSVYLYALYDGEYGNADGGLMLSGFQTLASVATYTRSAPSKTKFTTSQTFVFGGSITETWNYDSEHPSIHNENDAKVSFELQDFGGDKIVDLTPGVTPMLLSYDGKYVSVKYNGIQVQDRYPIEVLEAFDKAKGEYHLSNSASDLEIGDHILIAAANSDVVMKDGFTSTNNITGVTAAKNASTSTIAKTNGLDIELVEGAVDGSFGLRLESGELLIASSTSKNYLQVTDGAISKDSSFVFSYDEGWSIIGQCATAGARTTMQYNPNNGSPIFSCYSSASQSPLAVYVYKSFQKEAATYATSFIKGSENANTCAATMSAWSTLRTAYGKLTSGAKELFVNENHHEPDGYEPTEYTIAHAIARYDLVLKAYGTSTYNDFMGRVDAGKLSLSNSIYFGIDSTGDDNIPLIITVATSVGLLATGGLFLISRRRREE